MPLLTVPGCWSIPGSELSWPFALICRGGQGVNAADSRSEFVWDVPDSAISRHSSGRESSWRNVKEVGGRVRTDALPAQVSKQS